jgi:hypothetical protein
LTAIVIQESDTQESGNRIQVSGLGQDVGSGFSRTLIGIRIRCGDIDTALRP